jgi:zinc finger protein
MFTVGQNGRLIICLLCRFLEKFDDVLKGDKPVTIILDDPTGNSYVQALTDDGVPDPNLRIIRYHRSYDQNEELGLNDMKVEGYEEKETA